MSYCGMRVRGVGDLEHPDHKGIIEYMLNSERLALSYMGKEMKRGLATPKKLSHMKLFLPQKG